MRTRFFKLTRLKKVSRHFDFLILLLFSVFSISSCQQSSDDSTISGVTDRSAPTTSFSASAFCSVSGLTVNTCTASPITITFTVNENATIYYAQGTSISVPVSTSSSSVASGGSISVTGMEGSTVYVAFFARDVAGNSESRRVLTISIPDLTDPEVTISFVVTADGSDCVENGSPTDYLCEGPITVTMTAIDNTATTIYYEATTDTAAIPNTSSTQYSAPISIDVHNTYLSFFAQDSANNQSGPQTYNFEINGITPTINGGYYNNTQFFKFALSSNRTTPNGYYQLYYLEKTGTDVSADSTADIDSVFTSGASPTANSNADRYLNTYLAFYNDTSGDIIALKSDGDTAIYQYKYNLIYDGTQDATGDVINGSVDQENTLVLYIDNDTPKAVVIPPSSGSLSSAISVSTYMQDNGHDKIEKYAATNPSLAVATPLQSSTASYCKASKNPEIVCTDFNDWLGLSNGQSVTISKDTQIGLTGRDAANNYISCNYPLYKQYNCYTTPPDNLNPDPDISGDFFIENYTPGMQETSYYHENENQGANVITNFGHSIAVGDLDGDGSSDIAIGAPAYSFVSGSGDIQKGAVYVWYNKFRERALLSLIDNNVTTDVSGHFMDFATDGNGAMRIFLDPSSDSSGSTDKFQAESGDYIDKNQATASEIASVLNEAFLTSYGKTYQNYLYADASTDGKLSIGHINKTIQGAFTYTSNFDPTSDMYRASSNPIKAYDYVIYGENDGDQFGYSIAIGKVDTSVDTATYSASQLVVGAPRFDSYNGALYVIRMPASDASADYGTVTLADSTDDAYIIHATSGTGRLGHAITLYDNTSDSINDIYTSAPYYSGAYTQSGAVYKIDQQIFPYSDATNDITTAASTSYEWRGTDELGNDADNALFGFSLTAGQILSNYLNPAKKYLIIGVPGHAASMVGKIAFLDIRSTAAPFVYQLPDYLVDPGGSTNTYFGYSLAIVNDKFDTSASKCPCLVTGAPNAAGSKGEVWILGNFYMESVTGAASSDMIGKNLLAGKIGVTDDFDTLFISAESAQSKGHIVIVRKQVLTSGTDVTAQPLNSDLNGPENGNHLGQGLGIISVNGVKGLATGLPGEFSTYTRIGKVRIYSGARLGY